MSCPRSRSRNGCSRTRASSSGTRLAWRPSARVGIDPFLERLEEAAEPVEVELPRLDAEKVAGRLSDEAVAELTPTAKDVVLKRAEGRRRWIASPDKVDEPLGRDDAVS